MFGPGPAHSQTAHAVKDTNRLSSTLHNNGGFANTAPSKGPDNSTLLSQVASPLSFSLLNSGNYNLPLTMSYFYLQGILCII